MMDRRERRPHECECGVDLRWLRVPEDKRRHGKLHRQYESGIALPKRFRRERVEDGIISVSDARKGLVAEVAYEKARVVQRQGRYDFCSFVPGAKEGIVAYVYVDQEARKAVGYLAAYYGPHWGELADHPEEEPVIHEDPKLTVSVVFVCPEYRRCQIAKKLAGRCSSDGDLASPAELVWQWPFTEPGLALAKSVCAGGAALRIGR
jgi:GNAT superfamily N-acetyltransferase